MFLHHQGIWSRSTWACELKLTCSPIADILSSHAPRERVSWNLTVKAWISLLSVTLHVSVWVEISIKVAGNGTLQESRSTWACELKCTVVSSHRNWYSHAPRERVSWNWFCRNFQNQRYVTLHVSVWVEITLNCTLNQNIRSRSTWACELKLVTTQWQCLTSQVTLHVSVWVEMHHIYKNNSNIRRHAPRERVSWNCIVHCQKINNIVTLHVSVWVEIHTEYVFPFVRCVTLHVSVWVEIW